MSAFDEQLITQAVLDRFSGTPDPRLKQLVTGLTQHLHAFVRETKPTMQEWVQSIEYLTAVGQMCDDKRQEFILLSDVLGVSMLVDTINHASNSIETHTSVLGPFFVENSACFEQGADISGGLEGEPLYVDVSVCSVKGSPIPGATVEVWQSNSEGFYDVQLSNREEDSKLRGTFATDEQGRVQFWSILPTAYPIPHDGPVGALLTATNRQPWRPAHLHFKLSAPGYRTVVTQLFVEDDEFLNSDAVFGVKDSLVCAFPHREVGLAVDGRYMDRAWRTLEYDFVLGSDRDEES